MMDGKTVDSNALEWRPHPNPKNLNVSMKTMVDAQTNPLATVHRVRIAVGGEIVPHIHEKSAESFFITAGRARCTMGETTTEFHAGSLGYAPMGIRHGLKNIGDEDVELVAIFTPPT